MGQAIKESVEQPAASRLVELEGKLGKTFLLEVTNSIDPTSTDIDGQGNKIGEDESVRQMMKRYLADPKNYLNTYDVNNGVVVAISDKYSEKPSVYLSVTMVDPGDESSRDITTYTLEENGFKRVRMYVPFSFQGSEMASEYIKAELQKSGDTNAGEKFVKEFPLLEDTKEGVSDF